MMTEASEAPSSGTNSPAQVSEVKNEWTRALRELDRGEAMLVGTRGIELLGPTVFGDQVVAATLQELGDEWEAGERSLAELYMAGRISADVVTAQFAVAPDAPTRIGIAVLDDYHSLGKTMVTIALHSAGIPVKDYGTLEALALAEAAVADNIGLLFVSTLMLRSAEHTSILVARIRELNATTKVVVGGAPFRISPELWRAVGADEVGYDAAQAVSIARRWLEERP